MRKEDRVREWVRKLTVKEMRPLLVELVEFAMESEMVSFPDLAPYWGNTGEPLVEGQQTFSDTL